MPIELDWLATTMSIEALNDDLSCACPFCNYLFSNPMTTPERLEGLEATQFKVQWPPSILWCLTIKVHIRAVHISRLLPVHNQPNTILY